jgi:hypothetical protein
MKEEDHKMSCFVVNKASFAKAAGIVAGIADAANQGASMDRFWLYDTKKNRNMTGTDYLDRFFQIYEMNCKSVSESWKEEQPVDKKQYAGDFKRAVSIGKKLYYHRWENGAYLRAVQELRSFFSSVRYQIDNPELERKAANFMNAITVKLFEQLDSTGDHDSWGELDLATFEEIITEEETQTKLYVKRAMGIETA